MASGLASQGQAAGTDAPAPLSSPVKVLEDRLVTLPDLGALFDASGTDALDSGFTTTILLAFRWEAENPAALPALPLFEIKLRYDVWDETWWYSIGEPGKSQRVRLASRPEALRRAASPGPIALFPLESLPEGVTVALQMRAVLNPMSAEELGRVQEWLRRPEGPDSGLGWVGSMIGFLVDEQSGFSTRTLEGRTAYFRREGGRIHAAD